MMSHWACCNTQTEMAKLSAAVCHYHLGCSMATTASHPHHWRSPYQLCKHLSQNLHTSQVAFNTDDTCKQHMEEQHVRPESVCAAVRATHQLCKPVICHLLARHISTNFALLQMRIACTQTSSPTICTCSHSRAGAFHDKSAVMPACCLASYSALPK